MKERKDLKPEDVPNDTTILIVIDGTVFELEDCDEQNLFGITDEYC
jgi:hypothetical protein